MVARGVEFAKLAHVKEAFMRALAMAVMLFASPAAAEDSDQPVKPPSPEQEVAIAFGAGHPECQEWTDGCMVCKRVEDKVACSTPGIACQPVATICTSAAK
jgi:hypothetical protein